MSILDQGKMLIELKRIQSALSKETVEAEGGNGAVKIIMTGEQKVKEVILDADLIEMDDLGRLEKWLESAINQAITKSQQVAAEKMKGVAGGLGLPGL
jgi:DNA-binding YbaB/EbfC family protein